MINNSLKNSQAFSSMKFANSSVKMELHWYAFVTFPYFNIELLFSSRVTEGSLFLA